MRDYYEILGAERDTSDSELKKKYRKLAMQYHPDKNPGDEEAESKFREIGQAYDVLKHHICNYSPNTRPGGGRGV